MIVANDKGCRKAVVTIRISICARLFLLVSCFINFITDEKNIKSLSFGVDHDSS